MIRTIWLGLIVLATLMVTNPSVLAQDGQLNEQDYRARLQQSDQILAEALRTNEIARAGFIRTHNNLWEDVTSVMLDSGIRIEIDPMWMVLPEDATDDELVALQKWIKALINPQVSDLVGVDSTLSIETLREIMQNGDYGNLSDAPSGVGNGTRSSQGSGDTGSNGSGSTQRADPPRLRSPRSSLPPIGSGTGALGGLAQICVLAIVVIGVITAIYLIVQSLRNREVAVKRVFEGEDIPESSDQATTLASESEAIHDFRTAIRYLYLASMLTLDERNIIHFDPHLTNREHLKQLHSQPQKLALLSSIVSTFDRVWYGFAPADEALFEQFRLQVEQLKKQV